MKFKYLLEATGGGCGGGWNSELGFRELSHGFSVWISGEERFSRHIKSSRPLNWRTAYLEMLSFEAGWIGCECRGLKNVYTRGISGWQSELLVLSSVNQEELGFEDVVKTLVRLDEEDLGIISRRIGTFYDEDTLMTLRDIFELYPGNPLKLWELLGGVPDKFSLSDLLARIEEEHEKMAEQYEEQISTLVHAVLGDRPTSGVISIQGYEFRRSSLERKIIQILLKTKKLPSTLELTG